MAGPRRAEPGWLRVRVRPLREGSGRAIPSGPTVRLGGLRQLRRTASVVGRRACFQHPLSGGRRAPTLALAGHEQRRWSSSGGARRSPARDTGGSPRGPADGLRRRAARHGQKSPRSSARARRRRRRAARPSPAVGRRASGARGLLRRAALSPGRRRHSPGHPEGGRALGAGGPRRVERALAGAGGAGESDAPDRIVDDGSMPYDPVVYARLFQRMLRHRNAETLAHDVILPTETLSVYDFAVAARDLVPAEAEAESFIREVERRYPDPAALGAEIARWWQT